MQSTFDCCVFLRYRAAAVVWPVLAGLALVQNCSAQSSSAPRLEVATDKPQDAIVTPSPVGSLPGSPSQEVSSSEKESAAVTFEGVWASTYGKLVLESKADGRYVGKYPLGTISGTVEGKELAFVYDEGTLRGVGQFQLAADGKFFTGRWKAYGSEQWQTWDGRRMEAAPPAFEGLWDTSYGRMRLVNENGKVTGSYSFQGKLSTLEGSVEGNKLRFTYRETSPNVVGEGLFVLSPSQKSFGGRWRPKGAEVWSNWEGTQAEAKPGVVWLVVLEANWETRLEEPEYNFGTMLRQFFKMGTARHVQFRHRFFHDLEDLQRFCVELRFFAEPFVLLISTHGTPEGITVFGDTIDAEELAVCLQGASNMKLLHLSGCAMMASSFAKDVQQRLQGTNPTITGYETVVDWDTSALADFIYLSLVLLRDVDPVKAVAEAARQAPFLGDEAPRGGEFEALGLKVVPPLPESSAGEK